MTRGSFASSITKGTSGGECYGTWDPNTETGKGPGHVNNCIHSGGQTVWYNYAMATAGTIVETSTTANATNTTTATQSICPKGWTLPSKTQIDSQRDVNRFSPVLGGYYFYGTLNYESTYGYWWGSTAYNGARRYSLGYNGSSLYTDYNNRYDGLYIRCVSEEKDVSDLTYMQDMTPSVATNTAWNLCPK